MRLIIISIILCLIFSGCYFVMQRPLSDDQLTIFGLIMMFYFFGIITGWYNS